MSAHKVIKPWHCNDCLRPHGRPYPNVSLCFDCRTQRLYLRRRTPKYRRWKLNWSRSPRGKILKQLWADKNRVRIAEIRRRYYLNHKKKHVVICAFANCKNVVVRPKGSHRWMCDECAIYMYGKSYLTWRSRIRGKKWDRASREQYAA